MECNWTDFKWRLLQFQPREPSWSGSTDFSALLLGRMSVFCPRDRKEIKAHMSENDLGDNLFLPFCPAQSAGSIINYMRCPQLPGGRDRRGSDKPTTMKLMTLESQMDHQRFQSYVCERRLSVRPSVCLCVSVPCHKLRGSAPDFQAPHVSESVSEKKKQYRGSTSSTPHSSRTRARCCVQPLVPALCENFQMFQACACGTVGVK